jgi:hypothetical protein
MAAWPKSNSRSARFLFYRLSRDVFSGEAHLRGRQLDIHAKESAQAISKKPLTRHVLWPDASTTITKEGNDANRVQ